MCGRYASTRGAYDLAVEFDAVDVLLDEPLRPDYNIAPTVDVPIVRRSRSAGGRVVDLARWGLVPSWAADPAIGSRMFNARAETLADKPAFRAAFLRRRCLVAADGWYEWAPHPDRPGKQAYYLAPADGSPLVFAGLWEVWGTGPDRLTSCTIVTTLAVGQLRAVHDRMPLVLPAERWTAWLGEIDGVDGRPADPAEVSALLAPTPAELVAAMELRPVGPAVGNVRNTGRQLREPVLAGSVPEPAVVGGDTLF